MKSLFRIGAFCVGCAFALLALHVAIWGTGTEIPSGENTAHGRVSSENTVEVPVGDSVVHAEVKLTRPGSRALEQSWTEVVGDDSIRFETEEGQLQLRVPPPSQWKAMAPTETLEVHELENLAVVGEIAKEAQERLAPPYLILVRALRHGNAVTFSHDGNGSIEELFVGSPQELAQWISKREQGRWPVVILLVAMSFVSIVLSRRAFNSVNSKG